MIAAPAKRESAAAHSKSLGLGGLFAISLLGVCGLNERSERAKSSLDQLVILTRTLELGSSLHEDIQGVLRSDGVLISIFHGC